jgi:hypothetical protein
MNSYMYYALKALLLFLLTLLASHSVSIGQVGPKDPPKPQGAIRIGVGFPRVTQSGTGTVGQEVNSLRQNLRSYLRGPGIGTVELVSRLESLALEEGKQRQCEYVLFVSMVRQAGPSRTGTNSRGTKSGDEFTLTYRLISMKTLRTVIDNTNKARVSVDGEDVLTPMIEMAAQSIVDLAKANAAPLVQPATGNPTSGPSDNATKTNPKPRAGADELPKSKDAIRIGLIMPRVIYTGGGNRGSNEATLLKQEIHNYLAATTIETIDMQSRVESLALGESRKRECDYLLSVSLTRKRSGGGGGSLKSIVGSTVGTEIDRIPGGNTARKVATGAATMATFMKADDELILEYKLLTIATETTVIAKTLKSKVKSDGQDALTPMIETTAQELIKAMQARVPE